MDTSLGTYHENLETIKNGQFKDSLFEGYCEDSNAGMNPNDAQKKGLARNTNYSLSI